MGMGCLSLTFRRGFAQHEVVRRANHSTRFLLFGILIISIANPATSGACFFRAVQLP